MDWWIWVVILAGIAVLAAVAFASHRRTSLREQFGPEYDRAVEDADSPREAEHALRGRLKQHRKLELRPLSSDHAEEYARRWFVVQSRFVDDPGGACREAGELLEQVLRERGYPVEEDFDTQADLVSVDHPNLVAEYRTAHEATARGTSGDSGTEDLRVAFVAYRNLFAELLEEEADDLDDDVDIDLTATDAPRAGGDADVAHDDVPEDHDVPVDGRR